MFTTSVAPQTAQITVEPEPAEIAERRELVQTEAREAIGRAREAHLSMTTTECEGEVHLFKSDAAPGSTCACGKTVWIQPRSAVKGTGPVAVNEELRKSGP
jgi:hypothetical protein